MMEIIQDPSLAQALRDEIAEGGLYLAGEAAPGQLDPRRVGSLPLLQSVYIETMRLHVSFSVTRQVRRGPVELVPGFSGLETGAIVQACSHVAHLDEAVWGADGHPATEFWAYRHVRFADDDDDAKAAKQDGVRTRRRRMVFAMKARPSAFFPFGALLSVFLIPLVQAFDCALTSADYVVQLLGRGRILGLSRPSLWQDADSLVNCALGLSVRV
jgi:hypothetical protein